MTPTAQQRKIIEWDKDLVIVANPGSGKTFVISEKIKQIFPRLYDHKGVIAISYTNKATIELRNRSLRGGIDSKSSFFGTIDKFFISEIIIPFGKQIFGLPLGETSVIKRDDLSDETKKSFDWLETTDGYKSLSNEAIQILKQNFISGIIVLETVALLALYVLNKSQACKNYLRARYSYVIIDEYQDSGKEQHQIFLIIQSLGICAIAVGDANQSIFKFSGKSSEFLLDLASRPNFKLFALDVNHRCHPSIINYSLRLLNAKSSVQQTSEIRVFEKNIQGAEVDIAKWLDSVLPQLMSAYAIKNASDIGVLVRSSRTGAIMNGNLKTPHKYFVPTLLDDDFTIWSSIFRDLLALLFDDKTSQIEFIENYVNIDHNAKVVKLVINEIKTLHRLIKNLHENIIECLDHFQNVAKLLNPTGNNRRSVILLREVLSKPELIESFKPPKKDEIQVMTLHKSKGLEFDIVFHLDLYEFILPAYKGDRIQDLNLHYVGITRARCACILCSSALRTNANGEIKAAKPSDFLQVNGLTSLRKTL